MAAIDLRVTFTKVSIWWNLMSCCIFSADLLWLSTRKVWNEKWQWFWMDYCYFILYHLYASYRNVLYHYDLNTFYHPFYCIFSCKSYLNAWNLQHWNYFLTMTILLTSLSNNVRQDAAGSLRPAQLGDLTVFIDIWQRP